ncbi:MAG: DNA polymerase III subunit alpha [Betaproteobacteria bacterium]|nr:DNA polymerase III subunit alpha [Betaproteobacteria bacterium]
MASTIQAVNLRCHSEYSLAAGMLRLAGEDNVGKLAAERGIGALALTDDNNISGASKFFTSCRAAGVKPILGCLVRMAWGEEDNEFRLTLLVRDEAGFASLSRLLTAANEREDRRGTIDASGLQPADFNGLAATAGFESDLAVAVARNDQGRAAKLAERWRQLLGDYYFVELTVADRRGENAAATALASFAASSKIAAVAAHPALFAHPDDFAAQEIRACIASGHRLADPNRPRLSSPEQYLLDAQQMQELFAEFPGALENACQLAAACNWNFTEGGAELPRLAEHDDAPRYLRELAERGLAELNLADREEYRQRLAVELEVIVGQGFADYYLIVSDFVRFAKQRAIAVGPGRGSGSGSLVAYCLHITGIDPIEYGLLFERFLNPERISMPDFDIDFCMDRREEVISYVREKYGADCVSQIATFGTLGAKAVVRDVGRVLGMPYTVCDEIARLIPGELNVTLDSAHHDVDDLRKKIKASEELQRLWGYAKALEGLPRNAGTHAGGVLIAPRPLAEICPLMHVGDGDGLVSQFDKDDLGALGLVKFDFLGLRTLTMIEYALEMIREAGHTDFTIADLDLADPAAFKLYRKTDTIGVFQCEAAGMREVMRRMEPNSLEDIAALISLYRPGPIKSQMTEDYLQRRAGDSPVSYLHPKSRPILKPTYGTIVFQEQVLQLAQQLADFSLGQADVLRKAMGSKNPETMEKARSQFVAGAANTLGKKNARELYDSIAEFAGYAFNKAHAVGYAILSVQTACLKANHPVAFYAALMSTNFQDQDALAKFATDAKEHGIGLLAPDVNQSEVLFVPATQKRIHIGLASIRGVGRHAASAIVAARREGRFTSLADMCNRTGAGTLSRLALENLIKAGACDSLIEADSPGASRSLLTAELPAALSEAAHSRAHQNQEEMFGGHPDAPARRSQQAVPWPQMKVLKEEYQALGMTVSGHFFDAIRWLLRGDRGIRRLDDVEEKQDARIAGCILAIKTPPSLRKQGIELVVLDDGQTRRMMRIDKGALPEGKLQCGDILICTAQLKRNKRQELQFYAKKTDRLPDYWVRQLRAITFRVSPDNINEVNSRLASWHSGKGAVCRVRFKIDADDCEGEVKLEKTRIPDFESVSLLGEKIGTKNIEMSYQ